MGDHETVRTARVALLALVLIGACANDDDPGSSATTAAPRGATTTAAAVTETKVESFSVPAGSRPHDVWVRADGTVWYTAQGSGELGLLDPRTGNTKELPLGSGSRPHGVIGGPDGAAWITDGGLNAIVRVEPDTDDIRTYPLPENRPNANLNTAVFAGDGTLWFTGQSGIYGRLRPGADRVEVFDAPRGRGPYGITAVPGAVYYASLAGSHVARLDLRTGAATVLEPPTADQGTRRVWADSKGRIWSSQWNVGQVAVFDPATEKWQEWKLPGASPQAYAVYVDDRDVVWLSDFGANALVSFDATTERFTSFPLPSTPSNVRQIHGRTGEVWGAESAADRLVVVRHG